MWGKNRRLLGRDMGALLRLRILSGFPGLGPLLVGRTVGQLDHRSDWKAPSWVGGLKRYWSQLVTTSASPRNSILRYETALKADKFVLIAHGSSDEITRAKEILGPTKPETMEHHQ